MKYFWYFLILIFVILFVMCAGNKDEFCSENPGPRIVELPEGCQVDNSSFYDVGTCSTSKCRGDSSDEIPETCGETLNNCCGPLSSTFIHLDCTDFTFGLFVVESCGCTDCLEPSIEIIVSVVNVANNSRVPGAELLH